MLSGMLPSPAYLRLLRCLAIVLCASAAVCAAQPTLAEEDLTVLAPPAHGIAPGKQFELWLKQRFYELVDQRTAAFERLNGTADCRQWQEERRAFFLRQIGGLPDRTPLRPQIVGTLEGSGYRVEKIVFESRPGFHVTANLYLPASAPPWPGVIVP